MLYSKLLANGDDPSHLMFWIISFSIPIHSFPIKVFIMSRLDYFKELLIELQTFLSQTEQLDFTELTFPDKKDLSLLFVHWLVSKHLSLAVKVLCHLSSLTSHNSPL